VGHEAPAQSVKVLNRQSIIKRWLIVYLAALLGSLPIALPIWNGFLRDTVGSFITVEQIHILQYGVLGWLLAMYALADTRRIRTFGIAALLIIEIGICDEAIQGALPQRFFEWSDVGLNFAGGILGMFLLSIIALITRRWKTQSP